MKNILLVSGFLIGFILQSEITFAFSGKPHCIKWGGTWQETTVFFGKSTKDGRAVSRQALDGFVRDVIVPAFPFGFTLLETTGYWYSSKTGQTIYENGFQLVVLHPSEPEEDLKFDAVAEKYRAKFEQTSVLISTHAAEPRECKAPTKE